MCGISGFVDGSASFEDLQKLHSTLRHRGPDADGFFFESPVGLAHNRLSIIDLSPQADQPMVFEHLIIIFNGEIYNFREIKHELISKGYDFNTVSDTEVLIKGFHCWGPKVVDRLIGMFSIAIYDKTDKKLFLIRDRLGVKPLYYFFDGRSFYFFSELKAWLYTCKKIDVDGAALKEFLKFGYVVSNRSIVKDVQKVPPGCYVVFESGKVNVTQYWNLLHYAFEEKWQTNEEQTADALEELLVSSFKYRMVADVSVGIFFSGGIDSSLLVALLTKYHGKVNTFTIGFKEADFNEAPYARKIADFFKTNHTEQILSRAEAEERLSSFYKIYDEPFFDSSGVPTSLVAELAHKNGMKVVLSSEGGDELFAGYPSYKSTASRAKSLLNLPSSIRSASSALLNQVGKLSTYHKRNQIGRASRLLKAKTLSDFYIENTATLDNQIGLQYSINSSFELGSHKMDEPEELFMLWDLLYLMPNDFLVKIDRATMYHGVESREPFLDHRLIEYCLRIPYHMKYKDGQPKYLLRKILARHLPSSFFDRPKMGFSIPLFTWFKQDLDKMLFHLLNRATFTENWPSIDYRLVKRELEDYNRCKLHGKEKNMLLLWKFLNLMLWKRAYELP